LILKPKKYLLLKPVKKLENDCKKLRKGQKNKIFVGNFSKNENNAIKKSIKQFLKIFGKN
jgi:hypothetical protein